MDEQRDLTLDALSELVTAETERARNSIEAGEMLYGLEASIKEQQQIISLLIEHIREWTGEWSEHLDRVEESVRLLVSISELILLVISTSNMFGPEARRLRGESQDTREVHERRESLRRQLATHTKNLNWQREQAARHADNVPVNLLSAIELAEDAIERIQEELGIV